MFRVKTAAAFGNESKILMVAHGVDQSPHGEVDPPEDFLLRDIGEGVVHGFDEPGHHRIPFPLDDLFDEIAFFRKQAFQKLESFSVCRIGAHFNAGAEKGLENFTKSGRLRGSLTQQGIEEGQTAFVQGADSAGQDRHDEIVFGPEIIIDGGNIDPSRGGDIAEGGGPEPIAGKKHGSGVEDLLPRIGRARRRQVSDGHQKLVESNIRLIVCNLRHGFFEQGGQRTLHLS